MSEIAKSEVMPDKDPNCYLHCAIFLVDNSLIDKAQISKYVQAKVLDKMDQTLLDSGIVSDDVFRVHSIQGQEQISNPFNFDVELHGNTDTPGGPVKIDFNQYIGRPVTLGINLPTNTFIKNYNKASRQFIDAILGTDNNGISLFNGIVTSFAIKQPGVYELSVKPALWKLSLTNRYKLYYKKNIKDVITEILDRHNIVYNMDGISGDDNIAIARTQDWLQAGESDYEFIQRIMGKAHIYYFIKHEATKHTIVFANKPAYPDVFTDKRKLRYAYTEDVGLNQDDVIKEYNFKKTLMSSSVSTVFTTMQNAWQADPNISYQTFEYDSKKQVGELPFQLYRIYQYGGSRNETAEYTRQSGSTLSSAQTAFSGAGTYAGMRSGYKFSVTSDDAKIGDGYPVRPCLEGKSFVLTQVQHHASGDGGYQNQFQATESDGLVTQFNLHETRQGSMLAEVVQSDGSDALAGNPWYGDKSDFDPEQSTVSDLQASPPPTTMNTEGVYVKLSSDGSKAKPFWIKLAPHMQQAPEVGAIVLISRSSDDSEIPEIQNVIQNNGNKTVTPSGWTTNTQVGSNYSTSYGDSKSVRYGKNSKADLDKAVNIVQQAYKTGKFKDCSYSQGASYSYSTAEKGKQGILSKSKSFGSTYSDHTGAKSVSYSVIDSTYSKQTMIETESYTTISDKSYSESTIGQTENVTTINGLSKSTSTIGSSENTTTINKDSTSTSTIKGNSTSTNTINGESKNTSTIGSSINTSTINADSKSTSTVKGDSINTNTVDGESNNTSTVGSSVNTSTVNGESTSTSTNKGNVTNTNTINANSTSTTTITGSSTNTSTISASNNVSIIGASANTNVTGVSANTSVTGASLNTNVTGRTVNTSLTGQTVSTNLTGAAINTSISGITGDISIAGSTNSLSVKGVAISLDIWGTGVKLGNEAANVNAQTVGTVAEVVSAIKVIL